MLEYLAYALLGLVMICCLLYVTIAPEAEEPPKRKSGQIPSSDRTIRP